MRRLTCAGITSRTEPPAVLMHMQSIGTLLLCRVKLNSFGVALVTSAHSVLAGNVGVLGGRVRDIAVFIAR